MIREPKRMKLCGKSDDTCKGQKGRVISPRHPQVSPGGRESREEFAFLSHCPEVDKVSFSSKGRLYFPELLGPVVGFHSISLRLLGNK